MLYIPGDIYLFGTGTAYQLDVIRAKARCARQQRQAYERFQMELGALIYRHNERPHYVFFGL